MNFPESYSEERPPPPGVDQDNGSRSSCASRDQQERERDRSRRQEHRSSSRDSYRHGSDRYRDRDYDDDGYRGRYDKDDRRSSSSHRSSGDRYKDYDRDRDRRDRDRHRDRNYDMSSSREDWREDIPNHTIMVRGLSSQVTEDDIRNHIVGYGLQPKDVRLMRKKETGMSRGFAFVEFELLSEAVRWKELTRGLVFFDGQNRSTLHYSIPKDALALDRLHLQKADWTCTKCGVNNFRRRDYCFKCNSARDDIDLVHARSIDGGDEVSSHPSNTLLFRNLDVLTSEERVLSMLGQITSLPIKSLKVAKDKLTHTSRGFAFVELHSTGEATQLHDLLLSMQGSFFVDGRPVTVSYARRSLTSMNGTANANAASVALAAAQWTNQDTEYSSTPESNRIGLKTDATSNMGTVIVDGVTYQRYPIPDISSYKYDESSGYYYDPSTGLYYDSNSQYYYNSESQQYLYWDGERQTYLPAPSSTAESYSSVVTSAPTSYQGTASGTSSALKSGDVKVRESAEEQKTETFASDDKNKKQDKVKIAKKIAKEMEKWAKTLNQKKENAKMGVVSAPYVTTAFEMADIYPSSADAGFAILEKKSIASHFGEGSRKGGDGKLAIGFQLSSKASEKPALVAAYGGESDSEPEQEGHEDGSKSLDLLKAEEFKLTDWSKMACLMCKRQFPTRDALLRHQQFSDLHKKNLEMLQVVSSQSAEDITGDSGYRDRAKERRQKFGQPDVPPPSRLKTKFLKEREDFIPPEQPNKGGITADNIGNKMLKAMGWSEGQGLGKTGQGMSDIIEVQHRSKTAGLGMKGATYGASAFDSYKDAVKKSMQARYNEIAD